MNHAAGRAALLGLLVGCGSGSSGGGDIEVTDAWTRPTPATADNAAIYVSLVNDSGADDQLVGASSDRCALVQPHLTTVDDDGVASMAEAIGTQLELPDGDRLEMAPNGLHLMCIGVSEPFVTGEQFAVELRFAARPPLEATATVDPP